MKPTWSPPSRELKDAWIEGAAVNQLPNTAAEPCPPAEAGPPPQELELLWKMIPDLGPYPSPIFTDILPGHPPLPLLRASLCLVWDLGLSFSPVQWAGSPGIDLPYK